MAITTFNSQLPTTPLALEEKKPSKFSKVDIFKGWDNPFKKIALAVAHIFTALKDWICKPFSKNITKAEPQKTINATTPEPLKRKSISRSEKSSLLSSNEIATLKAQFFTLKQCEYARKYEEKIGVLPTEDHLLKVFNDKKSKQLNRKIDQLLEKLTPEDVVKLRERCNVAPIPAENTQNQEQVSLISFPGLLGFGTGVAATLTGITLSSYVNKEIVQPLIKEAKALPFIGLKITTALQGAAVLHRGWNWSKYGLNLSQNKTGIIAAGCMAGSIGYQGIRDYIDHPEKAISNESGCLTRQGISKVVNNTAIKLGRFCLSEKGSDSVKQKSFNYGYNVAQRVSLGVFACFTILDIFGLKPF